MNEDLSFILETEKQRYSVLYKIWKNAKRDIRTGVFQEEIAKELNISVDQLLPILIYLRNEELIETDNQIVLLTHKGLVEVEKSIKKPQESTEHFASIVIQYFHAPVESVQTGENSTINQVKNI